MGAKYQSFLIAMGGNMQSKVGSPTETLRAAVEELSRNSAKVSQVSRFYSTPCFPAGVGPDYVNAAAEIGFDGGPKAVLALLHRVEALFARARDKRWGQRTLDLDLLAAGDLVLPDAETQARWRDLPLDVQMREAPEEVLVPHPRLQDRAFVLVPLAEIAPDWVHPLLGRNVVELRDALDPGDLAAVRPIEP
ncbi:2-amino-4-hydroxy-6-hydroxymethyldihydropteridine diphosphokinase [Roseovarius aestuariivivens]|uniref:2-amino-4-hydroxy-6- hydroxymethyldihydropteridine diphosphokinase n=1 Tax=Roseovarius aestuariivivens TaxID=1888910 RepID=UPI0010821299|nr:2-amino-4-hydroxy-6-hydroxymethyldihydropteridine diphosphokinase [Roseovarius aestuariivivens]